MLGREFGHVETDVRALVPEQQAGQRLREFGFSNTRRASKERYPAGPPTATRSPDARDRALHDVKNVRYGMLLPLHSGSNELGPSADLVPIETCPRVLRDPDLVSPHGV